MKTHILILSLFAILFITLVYTLFEISKIVNQESSFYILEMLDSEIKVIDPDTGKVIYVESYETNSQIINALLEDNE